MLIKAIQGSVRRKDLLQGINPTAAAAVQCLHPLLDLYKASSKFGACAPLKV